MVKKCPECGKLFSGEGNYCSLSCKHTRWYPVLCEFCGKQFRSKSPHTVCCDSEVCRQKQKERLKANNRAAGKISRRTRATRKRVQSLEEAAAQARRQNITYGKLMEVEQTKESDRAMRERMERWKCLQKQQRNILS